MPSKRWYLEERDQGSLYVIVDGLEMDRNGKAAKFLAEKVILNRMNFEWNKSNFSRNFKHAKDATTFVKVWREVTEADDNGFERARKEQEYSSDHEDASESDGGLSKSVVTPSLATPPAKKLKVDYEKNSLDTAIQQKKIGLVKIDIRRLREPPPSRQLRKLDLTFVDALASKMTEDPFGPGVPPMAVVCTSVKSVEEFKIDFALHYAYEVHGGSHSYAARLKLLAIHPDDEQFLYALSDVYVALSDAECLRLAARHNINGHFHCEMSHRDYGMSRTSKENLFCQAAFPRSVWELAVKVMNIALVEVRKNFMKCTNSDTWEEVERRFGTYAEEKRLMQFVTLPFTNGIPKVFKDYCQAALTMTTTESSDCFMVHQNDARGYVICADPMMVTAADIKRTVNVFQGANLFIAQIPQVEAVQHFLFGIAIDEGFKGLQANTLAWDVLYPELMITLLQRMNHSPETSCEQSAIHYIKHLMS
ncbi:hypothetical protein EMCRGX_G018008 [Ephydatia muelleri]